MTHSASIRPRRAPSPAMTLSDQPEDAIGMRLLRHHTKNALQRIIAQVSSTPLRATEVGNALADEIERRVCLSARVSDALFGLTEMPKPLPARLGDLCRSVVDLMADQTQTITTIVDVRGACPTHLVPAVLQIAHEMITNAVKHGMHMRLTGTIAITLRCDQSDGRRFSVVLCVRDDGWGPDKPCAGEGLTVLQEIASSHGGTVELMTEPGWTLSRLHIRGLA